MNIEQAEARLSKIDEQLASGQITRSEHHAERLVVLLDLIAFAGEEQ